MIAELVLYYDGGDSLLISAPDTMKGTVQGLCGNFNGNSSDDMQAQDGRSMSTVTNFLRNWGSGDSDLVSEPEDPCAALTVVGSLPD